MALCQFDDAQIELLTEVLIEHAALMLSAGLDGPISRARFVTLSRIVAQIHEPRREESAPFTIHDIRDARADPFMRAAAEAEGIDLDKELGPMTPRAFTPRCTHGKLFTEDCPQCNDRCEHGLTMESPCAGCGRGIGELSTKVTVEHAQNCPASLVGFTPVPGKNQCTCDFGPRLAAAMGLPFGVLSPRV